LLLALPAALAQPAAPAPPAWRPANKKTPGYGPDVSCK
jgi:hypothetical protein